MTQYKAKKTYTMGSTYYWESEFEYRGHHYTVTYSSGFSAFKQKPAYIQHREAQANIDALIENKYEAEEKKAVRYEDTADYAIDMFLEYVNS